jgi:hypothetical protein
MFPEGIAMDRSLKVFLVTIFGVGGLVILLHTWLMPAALTERIMTTTFAVLGWALALVFH